MMASAKTSMLVANLMKVSARRNSSEPVHPAYLLVREADTGESGELLAL